MHRKFGPRAEYRQQENQRIQQSASLADKFQQLKSLSMDLVFFNAEGVSKNSEIKYTVNLAHARSVLRVDCHNGECIGGDFDLSQEISKAVATRQTSVAGEVSCQGWLNKAAIDRIRCHNILRYKLSLGY